MRERGLKHLPYHPITSKLASLPVRERGLKLLTFHGFLNNFSSLPVRERGLKHLTVCMFDVNLFVAPRAGAWIETLVMPTFCKTLSSRSPCGSVD